jgi:hypothetical protein
MVDVEVDAEQQITHRPNRYDYGSRVEQRATHRTHPPQHATNNADVDIEPLNIA